MAELHGIVYPAHIKYLNSGEKETQTVLEHCQNTANYAGSRLSSIGLRDAAYAAGLLHDMGKFTQKSKEYQEAAARGEDVKRGSVIHTFQGCRLLLEDHSEGPNTFEDLTRELLAYSIGAHHGLFDCYDESYRSGFNHRLSEMCDYEEARENFLAACGGKATVDNIVSSAHGALETVYRKMEFFLNDRENAGEELHFYLGLLVRLIASAVIDGDRRDTAEFMNDLDIADFPEDMKEIWSGRLRHMEMKLHEFQSDTPIKKARGQISNMCRDAAERESGVFRLNVPTGGGKTLSSLRFALAHAKKWNKRRIIITVPLLSIMDQNVAVIREFVGDDALILEHHSDVIREENEKERLNNRELLLENWNSPIIITTMVQLLNTMFLGKTSSIRRFSALADSIIVIDEVQTIPDKMLSLFNLTVNFLAKFCNTTIVLCSATQPALQNASRPLMKLDPSSEIIPHDEELWRIFTRTKVVSEKEALPLDKMPQYISEKLNETNSLLVVCNKKAQAEYLFENGSIEDTSVYHLSASMCMAHRRNTMDAINQALKNCENGGPKVLCISTQVIEAGVDISFGCVIRFAAGLESVVQSAGRCNRHGERSELAPVYVINCSDENLGRLPEIQSAKTAAIDLFYQYGKTPDRFQRDLTSDVAIVYYYQKLYESQKEGYQDYMIKDRKVSLFSMLSNNQKYAKYANESPKTYFLNQAFKTAGRLFQVFDSDSETCVVPYGEGKNMIEELAAEGEYASPEFLRRWTQKIKPYTVSIFEYQKKQLQKMDGLFSVAGITVLQPFLYDEELGMTMKKDEMDFLEV